MGQPTSSIAQGAAGDDAVDPGDTLHLGDYAFRRARPDDDLEPLHRLNHATFVRELGQHADPGGERLVDRFHARNRYVVALHRGALVGMLAVHDEPPFSVAAKLADPSRLDGLGPRPLEVRLLAVLPAHRHRLVLAGLALRVLQLARGWGHSHLLISGLLEQRRLYEHMGFSALGPAVASGAARFVPMVLALDGLPERAEHTARRLARRAAGAPARGAPVEHPAAATAAAVSFTPGVAQLSTRVREALARAPLDHRGAAFAALHARVRAALSALVGGCPVALFPGSGSLANEVVAATLRADPRAGAGLALVNGEFGRRLAEQAARAGLEVEPLAWDWGAPWDLDAVAERLRTGRARWIAAVHLETSTGRLNDLAALHALAREHGARLWVDAVSSLGGAPLDLGALPAVRFATGVANKALGGVAGLALVFAAPGAVAGVERARLPAALDLPAALAAHTPCTTVSSLPLAALDAALAERAAPGHAAAHGARQHAMAAALRDGLRELGLPPLLPDACAAPHVTTVPLPPGVDHAALLDAAERVGFLLGGRSAYLAERRWLQLATLGDVQPADCRRLLDFLRARLRADSTRALSSPPRDGFNDPALP